MYATRTSRLLCVGVALVLFMALGQPARAALGVTVGQGIKGTVQSIDYLHHTITVNGQIYTVAPHASFQGIAGFSVLHIGMPIAYSLGNSTEKQGPGAMPAGAAPGKPMTPEQQIASTSVIVSITWLPAGIRGK